MNTHTDMDEAENFKSLGEQSGDDAELVQQTVQQVEHEALADAALDYAAKDRKIFPCVPGAKTPATPNGFKNASSDLGQIAGWWNENPDYNLAFEPYSEKLLAVDIDPGADLSGLVLPATFTVRTPRGGKHLYYSVAEPIPSSANRLAPHVDVRCAGGYVLLPPSVTKDGSYKVIDDRTPVALPAEIAARLAKRTEAVTASADIELDQPVNVERAKNRLRNLVSQRDVAVAGQGGNARTYQLACELRELGLSSEKSIELVMEPGGWNDQCKPPWSEDELGEIFFHADKYGQNSKGVHAVKPIDEVFADVDFSEVKIAPQAKSNDAKENAGIDCHAASGVHTKAIEWLWPDRLAIGKVHLHAGYPGSGKSQYVADIAARITTGAEWPLSQEKAPRGAVLILSAEDDEADTIVPRLIAAGADLDEAFIVSAIVRTENGARTMNIADDLVRLKNQVRKLRSEGHDIKLAIIDPISAYLGGHKKGDSFKNADMRELLTPLAAFAADERLAIVAISHFNKGGNAHADYKITDSLAFVAAARVVSFSAFELDDEGHETGRVLLLSGKTNIGHKASTLAYRIGDATVADRDGGEIPTSHIEWNGTVNITAKEFFDGKPDKSNKLEMARDFLRVNLLDGPLSVEEIKERAGMKHSWRTIERAKSDLEIISHREGFGPNSKMEWELPSLAVSSSSLEEWEIPADSQLH